MRTVSPVRLIPFAVALFAVAPLIAGDLTPPQLTSFNFTPQTIDVTAGSANVTCTFGVTDDLSGVDTATCLFISPNVFQGQSCVADTPVSGNSVAGTFECTMTVPLFVDDGVWQVAVTLDDEVGNSVSFGTAELLLGPYPTELNVTATPDILPPAVSDLAFTPTAANVDGATAMIGCDMTLTDDAAGIVSAACQFFSPSFVAFASCISNSPAAGTTLNGTFSCNVPIPRYAEGGDWLVQLQAEDAVGNISLIDPFTLLLAGLPTTLSITSNTPDVTGPAVSNLTLGTTAVDVSGGSASTSCNIDQSDSPAGTEFAGCNLSSPSGMQSVECITTLPSSGTDQLGSYSCSLLVPMFSEPGTWMLTYITGDRVTNSTLLGPTALDTAGFSSELEVVCDSGVLAQPPVNWSSPGSFSWSPVADATQYNVYRGSVGAAGYGDCHNAVDPDLTDTDFADGEIPAPGTGFQFLIGAATPGGEVGLGYATDGSPRTPIPCP